MTTYQAHIVMIYFFSSIFYLVVLLMLVPVARPWLTRFIYTPKSSTGKTVPFLNAFRGLVVLWVISHYMMRFPSPIYDALQTWDTGLGLFGFAQKGVSLLAVLSGYLIYQDASNLQNATDLRTYALRRFLRIYPVFFIVTILLWIIGRIQYPDLLSELNLSKTSSGGGGAYFNPSAWTLFPLVCFYFAAPILASFRGKKWNALFYLILAGLFAAASSHQEREYPLWIFFWMGICLVEVEDAIKRVPQTAFIKTGLPWIVFIVGGTLFLCDIFQLFTIDDYLGYPVRQDDGMHLGLAMGTACVIFSGVRLGFIGWLFSGYFFDYLAAISFSLFLSTPLLIAIIYPKIDLNRMGTPFYSQADIFPTLFPYFFLAIPAALGFATLIHILVESPALRWRPVAKPQTTAVKDMS